MEIPNRRQINAGYFKLINGVWHKRCTGPAHDEETFLPWNEKYFYPDRTGDTKKFQSTCRLCQNWSRIDSPGSLWGLVEVSKVKHFYQEAVSRVGLNELARRTGIARETIEEVLNGETKKVYKVSLRKVMLELISMRRKNEHSISGRARWRNERRLVSAQRVCAGCGTTLNNFTEGCKPCTDRRLNQEKRREAA